MTARDAIARLDSYFAAAPTRQGILARRLVGAVAPGDDTLASDLARQLGSEVRADGSVAGAFVPTAWRIIELHDLGGDRAIAARIATWLLARQDAPGRFGEGCMPARHATRACEHFMRGFFAVAAPTERVAPITLPVGKVIRSEGVARFAASCLAARAVVLAGRAAQPGVGLHFESLAMPATGNLPSDHFTMEMLATALSTLAQSGWNREPAVAAYRDLLIRRQRDDGTWSGLDSFLALEALLAEGSDPTTKAVERAVPFLVASQRRDGTFGTLARQERALIGLRALVRVEG